MDPVKNIDPDENGRPIFDQTRDIYSSPVPIICRVQHPATPQWRLVPLSFAHVPSFRTYTFIDDVLHYFSSVSYGGEFPVWYG